MMAMTAASGLLSLSDESNIAAHCWDVLKVSTVALLLCPLSSCSVLKYWPEKEKPEG